MLINTPLKISLAICLLTFFSCGGVTNKRQAVSETTSALDLARSVDASRNFDVSAKKLGPTSFQLSWQIDKNMPDAFYNDGFAVLRKADGEFQEWKRISDIAARSADIVGLDAGKTYVFRVAAVRRNDVMHHSGEVVLVTDAPPATPTASPTPTPTGILNINVDSTYEINKRIFVSWHLYSISSLTGSFEVSINDSPQCQNPRQTLNIAGSSLSAYFNSLPIGTYYICAAFKKSDGTRLQASDNGQRITVVQKLPLQFKLYASGGTAGIVVREPSGTACSAGDCALYYEGTTVTLTARPGVNQLFSKWNGIDCTTPSCTVTITSEIHVSATFVRDPNPPPRKFIILGDDQVTCKDGYWRETSNPNNHCDCNDREDHKFVGCTWDFPNPPDTMVARISTISKIKVNGIYVTGYFDHLECDGAKYPAQDKGPTILEFYAIFPMSKDWSCKALYHL